MAKRIKIPWMKWTTSYVVLYGAYLLLVSTLTKPELWAGLVVAAIATIAAAAFGALGIVHFKPTIGQLLQAARIPAEMIRGTWAVFTALGKQLLTRDGAPSLMVAVPFEVGGKDEGAAARRALAVTYTTMTPNSVVLGIPRKQALLLYHQVAPSNVPQMMINLGARP